MELTRKEFGVLELLASRPGRVVSAETLLEKVWDYHFDPQTNVVDVLMHRLRAKIDGQSARDYLDDNAVDEIAKLAFPHH